MAASALAAVAVVGAACTPMSTWPPVDGAVGLDHPAIPPVPELMARAIAEIEERSDPAGERSLVFNLPAGTSVGVYRSVRRRLPDDARPMLASDVGQVPTVIHVEQVRLRGTDAEVDVVHRRGDGEVPQLSTVELKQRIPGGWRVTGVRTWYIDRAEPAPTFPEPEPSGDRTASADRGA